MRVLITGAGGYIGSVMCQEFLRHSHEVVAVDRPVAARNLMHVWGHKLFRWIPGDVTDAKASWWSEVQNVDAVIALAALVGQDACKGQNEEQAYKTNRDAVSRLVNRMRSDQAILTPNTNSGYGCGFAAKRGEYTELDSMDPQSAYGRSKVAGEAAVLEHPRGVSFRLGSGMGVSPAMRWDLLAHDFLLKVLRSEGSIDLYQPNAVRNFVHVRDIARAFRWAACGRLPGVFNLNHPVHCPKRMIVRSCMEALARCGVPVSVVIDEVPGTDADGRDGLISSEKICKAGFHFEHSLEDALFEVATLARDGGIQ